MESYASGNAQAPSSSSSSSAAADPYAQFYYWDAASNSWAFDYNSYYTAYGYPQQGSAGGVAAGSYDGWAQQQGHSGSSMPGYYGASGGSHGAASAGPSGWTDVSGTAADGGGDATKEKKRKFVPGPKDAEGNAIAGKLKRGETRNTVLRKGVGSTIFEDPTLLEWDPTHKRLFVGDLGNDVTDGMLARAFEKYPSFSKARVIRNKSDNKAKGYGFVAFADPHDFLKAWKEMDGKHIGSRPCRLKKAGEDINPATIGARKDKLLAAQYKYDAFKAKNKMGGAIGGDLRRHGIGKAWKEK